MQSFVHPPTLVTLSLSAAPSPRVLLRKGTKSRPGSQEAQNDRRTSLIRLAHSMGQELTSTTTLWAARSRLKHGH